MDKMKEAMGDRTYDAFFMGRSCIDLYSNDIGAPFVDIGSFAANSTNHCCVVAHQARKPAIVAAQAPATVARRHSRPNQNVMPIIGAILNQIFNDSTTGDLPSAEAVFLTYQTNNSAPATTNSEAIRPTIR